MEFEPIATELNVSDVFTTPLAVYPFAKHRSGLRIMPSTTGECDETCMAF
jgi:hypothetical protein